MLASSIAAPNQKQQLNVDELKHPNNILKIEQVSPNRYENNIELFQRPQNTVLRTKADEMKVKPALISCREGGVYSCFQLHDVQ